MEVETEITGRLIDAAVKALPPHVCSPQMRAHIAQQLEMLLKTKPTPVHPPYALMIHQAIEELNEEGGSDEEAISNSIKLKCQSLPWGHKSLLSHHLKKLSDVGEIVHASDGRFMLLPEESVDDSTTVTQDQKHTRKNSQKKRTANQHRLSKNDSSRSPEKEVGCEEKGAHAAPEVFEGGRSEKLGAADQALDEISLAVGEREEGHRGVEAVEHLEKGGYQHCELVVEGTALEKENIDAVDIQGQLQEESNHFRLEEDQAEMQEACQLADKQNQENGVTEKVNLENQIDEQSHDALLETQLVEMMEQQTQSERQKTVITGIMRQLLEKEKEIEGIEKLIASVGQSAEVIGNGVSLQEMQVEAGSRIADNRPILSCTFPSLRQGGSSISLKDKCLELINRTKKISKWTEETDKCIFGIMNSLSTAEISPNRKSEICVPPKKVINHSVASPDCSEVIDVMMIEAQNSHCFHNSKRPSESEFTALEDLSLRQEKRPKLSEQQDTVNFPSTSRVLEYSQQLVGDREQKLLKASEANYSCETALSLSLGRSSSFDMPVAASFSALRNEAAGVGTVGGEQQSSPPHGAAKAVTFHLETGEATVPGTMPVMPDFSKELRVASFVMPPQMQHQEERAFKEGKETDFEIGKKQQELEMLAQDIDKEGQEQQGRLLARQQHKQLDAEANAMPIFTAGTSPLVNSEQAELQWRLLNCEQHQHFESEENALPTSTAISMPPISYELSGQQRSLPTQWQREQLEPTTLTAAPRPPINYKVSEQQRGLPIQQHHNQFEPIPNAAPTLAAVARPQVNSEQTERQEILSSSIYYASPAEVTTPTLFSSPYPNAELSREHHQLEEQVSGLPVIDSSPMKPSGLSSGTLMPFKPAELDRLSESAARLQTPTKLQIDGQGPRAYNKKLRPRETDSSSQNP